MGQANIAQQESGYILRRLYQWRGPLPFLVRKNPSKSGWFPNRISPYWGRRLMHYDDRSERERALSPRSRLDKQVSRRAGRRFIFRPVRQFHAAPGGVLQNAGLRSHQRSRRYFRRGFENNGLLTLRIRASRLNACLRSERLSRSHMTAQQRGVSGFARRAHRHLA